MQMAQALDVVLRAREARGLREADVEPDVVAGE
jgi:hypothetical protein